MSQESAPYLLPDRPPRSNLLHWGYLEPLNPSPNVQRVRLTAREIYIGRTEFQYHIDVEERNGGLVNEEEDEDAYTTSYVVLPGETISKLHATFQWNGRYGSAATVMLTDRSSNGTFVDGVKLGQTNIRQVYDGHEISFGCPVPIQGQPEHDYRYIFRFIFEFDGQPESLRGRRKTEALFTHYDLQKLIGSGAHGVVHKASHKGTGLPWAVKSAFRDVEKEEQNSSFTSLAGQEVVTLLNLHHGNICRLKEVFFRLDGAVVDSVLEFVPGVTLQCLDGLADAHVREIAYQLSCGITYMHGRNIYHGDLKPDNVMITRAQPWTVKIFDFGLARLGSGFNVDLLACHRYSAPEARLQIDRLTFANTSPQYIGLWDSWAVGLMIFSLLTSAPPFVKRPPHHEGPFEIGIDQIEWHLLSSNSPIVQDAVKTLVVVDPTDRSTVSGFFRTHAWFTDYVPNRISFNNVGFYDDLAALNRAQSQSRMLTLRSRASERMEVDGSPVKRRRGKAQTPASELRPRDGINKRRRDGYKPLRLPSQL
ncbi:kinase-like domain-containing protein [Mycena amicta]|nr:kinase-like domain-containing protein [Mycena amicta]